MNNSNQKSNSNETSKNVTRRDFVRTAAVTAATVPFAGEAAWAAASAHAGGDETIKLGLIGCGGRGTGAAFNAIDASPKIKMIAMADLFRDHLESKLGYLREHRADRIDIPADRQYVGFNAYKQLIAEADVDMVILATPPHFRPIHLEEAIAAGKHVFMEKPVAVDPAGIRQVIAAGELAKKKNLGIVAGTQRRHEKCYLEAMQRIHNGEIGDVIAARCYWNQGFLWHKDKRAEWTEMEWQIRNWLYFTWLSGDHIVEQHVHNLDAVNWAMGDHPTKAMGMGGREVRTDPVFGNIFDHHAIEYEYPDGRFALSMCRQIAHCANRVHEVVHGTKGRSITHSGGARIEGENAWKFEGDNPNPYLVEHVNLINGIVDGKPLNEARRIAESTLTAIMGRMSTYTGKEVTWDQALNSKLDLAPETYAFGPCEVRPVSIPGKTPLI